MAFNKQFTFGILEFLKQKKETSEPIEKINLVKVYFLDEGRNVYWSQWKRTYIPEISQHLTMFEAKCAADELRRRGSKFTIEEIPGILITTKNTQALITNINTDKPFSGFSLRNLKSADKSKATFAFRRGELLHNALFSFQPYSDFWESNRKNQDEIIIVYGERKVKPITNRNRHPYMQFTSSPPVYGWDGLDWKCDDDSKVSDTYAYDLVRRSMRLNAQDNTRKGNIVVG